VSDGFDFGRRERREAKSFEPPPWEKEAFEQLRRRKDDAPEPAGHEETTATDPEPDAAGGSVKKPQVEAEGAGEAKGDARPPAAAQVDEGTVVEMMAKLAAQEPDAQRSLHALALSVSAAMGVFGLVLIVWGVVALARSGESGRIGVIGGSLFFAFGAASAVFAVWLMVKTLRQRGVL
jgi:hypothetical protein